MACRKIRDRSSDPSPMPLFSIGLNHETAPLAVRERAAVADADVPAILQGLHGAGATEAALVSTCNRTELYARALDPEPLLAWFAGRRELDLTRYLYRHQDDGAARHLICVAAGLDSLVLGEPQILGQIKSAYRLASAAGTAGPLLRRLFPHAFAAAKRIRTETQIGVHPVSVASTAIAVARRIFADFPRHTALLVGAGQMIELSARHLHEHGLGRMIVANRDADRARRLAARYDGFGIELAQLETHLHEADILVCCTASPVPLVRAEAVRRALRQRHHRPMLILDLAVPRDVEPATAELADTYVYTVDDLQQVIAGHLNERQQAARRADLIVDEELRSFREWWRAQDRLRVLGELHRQADDATDELLARARRRLARGEDPEQVLAHFGRTLSHRLLHQPSLALRRAALESDADLLRAAQRLYRLGPTNEDDE